MANSVAFVSTLFIILTTILYQNGVEAKRNSPLLIEDDGSSRRNRTAGKNFALFIQH